jgi:hypothetical protein
MSVSFLESGVVGDEPLRRGRRVDEKGAIHAVKPAQLPHTFVRNAFEPLDAVGVWPLTEIRCGA